MKNWIKGFMGATVVSLAIALAACGGAHDQKKGGVPAREEAATERSVQSMSKDPIEFNLVASPTLVPVPPLRTATETMNCVVDGLEADHRTLTEARTLQATDDVTIDGKKQKLGAGHTYYSRCAVPGVAEQLTATTTNFNVTTNALASANGVIRDSQAWIYRDTASPKIRENTWRYAAIATEESLADEQHSNGILSVITILLFILLMVACFRGTLGSWMGRGRASA